MMPAFLRDARYAMRTLARARGFTALAVLTLAIGIGSSTAVFSLIDAILIKPLPYPHPERMVMPHRLVPRDVNLGLSDYPWGLLSFRAFSREVTGFEHLGAFKSDSFNLTGSGEPEMITGIRASSGFFPAVGVAPQFGRFFTADEDQPGRAFFVVLSDRLWRDRFAASPDILGRTIELNGFPHTVVGVMPPGFAFPRATEVPAAFNYPREPQLWVPLALAQEPRPAEPDELALLGRMKPGVRLEQLQAEMDLASKHLEELQPAGKGWFNGQAILFSRQVAGDTRRPLLLMLGAVGVVLLIACSNVANLVLIRSLARSRELTVRAALGAGRVRLVSMLFAESVLLASMAGAVGLAFAAAVLSFAKTFGPHSIPRMGEASLNFDVFVFAFAVALGTGIIFGLAPAFDAARTDLVQSLKEGSRGTSGGTGLRIRSALVVFQVALALVLAIAAGLLVRSFRELLKVDAGFNPQSVLSFTLSLPSARYGQVPRITALFDDLLRRFHAIPGVVAAGIAENVPMGGTADSSGIRIPDKPRKDPKELRMAQYTIASPGYFAAVGTPLLRGRAFLESDTADSPPVVIISKALAEKFWRGEDPIGRQMGLGSPIYPLMTIVGIVADVKHASLSESFIPEMYVPYTQKPYPSMLVMRVVVRTTGDPLGAAEYVRQAMQRADPELPLAQVTTLQGIMDETLTSPRFAMLLIVAFGALALTLAAVGMYGVVSYSVTRRTREIGIRMALGAARRDVFAMVLEQGARCAVMGLALGIAAALAMTPLIGTFLYGVRPADPLTFAGVSMLLLAIALAACYVPARRAMQVDPNVALRYE